MANKDTNQYSPRVLRNKGIPIDLLEVEQAAGGRWRPVPADDIDENELSDPKAGRTLERVFVKFDFNVIADIEAEFGGIEQWQSSMQDSPASAVRKTLAFVLDRPVEQVGKQMVDGDLQHYGGVIGVAWALANGVDPFVATDMLTKLDVAEAEARAKQARMLLDENDDDEDKASKKEAPAEKATTPTGSG